MDINNILLYVCLLLAVLILFSILFGCRYKIMKERFTNSNNEKSDTDPTPFNILNTDEKNWLSDIASGKMNGESVAKLIADGKLTKENLSNMIKSCETFVSKKGNNTQNTT